MKNINCAAVIIEKRREKGVTQEGLAAYLGVTKASVSKWETGVSYPDIALLPILASYFDISIDCLMDYSPQMPDEDINKLYSRLAADFANKPFEEVISECEGIIKKYYSCYTLMNKMAMLYLTHATLADSTERSEQILRDAISLCERIRANSKDSYLFWGGTINIQAMCHLRLNEGERVLGLLGESLLNASPDRTLVAQAYKILGNEEKSEEAFQADLFQKLMDIFQTMMVALENNLGDLTRAEPIYLKAEAMATTFNMKYLNANNAGILYLFGAQMYQIGGVPEKAMELLSKFADVCTNDFFPFAIRADVFFDKLESFIKENMVPAPRSEEAVKKDIVQYFNNPIFGPLYENPDFKSIIKRINDFVAN